MKWKAGFEMYFAFKFNLHRYIEAHTVRAVALFQQAVEERYAGVGEVGLYKLNPVDPQLDSAWFQPILSLI
jgi:hypothetical protein